MSEPLLTFERFEHGRVIRGTPERVDAALLAHWRKLYPHCTRPAARRSAGLMES